MPGGRPSLYKPEKCETLIDLGREGKTHTQMACSLDISRETLYAWARQKPEFSDALTRATQYSQARWEDTGQRALHTPGFNAAVYNRQMANRFPADHAERKEIGGIAGKPIQTEEIEPDEQTSDRKARKLALALAAVMKDIEDE